MKKIEIKKIFECWHVIILIAILAVISYLNFRPGYSVLTNDNYSPELNPDLTISRIIFSPAWRGYRSLGVASDSESADIFRAIVFSILDGFIPAQTLSQGYLIFALVTGVLSFATLAKRIFSKKRDDGKYVYLIGGILYLTTLWTAWIFIFPMMPYVAQFGFLPLVLLTIYDFVQNPTGINGLKLFVSGLLLSTSSLISTLFFVNLGFILLFLIWRILREKKFRKSVGQIIFTVFLIIVPNLIWILPFPSYLFRTSSEIMDSSINRQITESTIDLEKEKMTAVNSSRFYTRILDIYDSDQEEVKMFEPADNYVKIEALKVLSFLPVFFSVLGLVFVLKNKKYHLIPIWTLSLIAWFFLKNQNEPFGKIYIWFQQNSSIFKQVFRWPTSKFGQIFLIGLGLTATYGSVSFFEFVNSFGKKGKKNILYVLTVVLVAVQLSYVGYLFYGQLVADRSYAQMPKEYKKLSEYLSENDSEGRIYILPPANNGYFREYDWGFIGSGFLWYEVPNPILEKALSIGSNESEFADLELENSYLSGYEDEFVEDLKKYDIEYLLVDKNLIEGRYGYDLDWGLLEEVVSDFEIEWEQGDLALYNIDFPSISEYVEVDENMRHEFKQEGFLSLENSSQPLLFPVFEDYLDLWMSDNYIEYVSEISVSTNEYLDNLGDIDVFQLPTKLLLVDDNLVARPAIPEIEGVQYDLPYKEFKNQNYDYFVVNQIVVDSKDLAEGYVIDYPYGQISSVFGLGSDRRAVVEHKTILDKLPTQDCTGESKGNTVDIKLLENGNFELKSEEGIGCVYSNLRFPGTNEYASVLNLEWKADLGTDIGVCIWSRRINSCLNDIRFYSTTKTNMQVEIPIEKTISEDEELSITLYILAKDGRKHRAEFENVEFTYLSGYNQLEIISENEVIENNDFNLNNVSSIRVKLPIIHSLSTYNYNSDVGYIGEPLLDTKGLTEYWADEKGSNIRTVEATSSFYNPSLNKDTLGKYLVSYYIGENVEGIPASLCASYLDDDRCWIEDVYRTESGFKGYKHLISGTGERFDLKFTNMSFSNESENYLSNFIIQSIPQEWLSYSIGPDTAKKHSVIQLKKVNEFSVLYSGENLEEDIITIPQSSAKGWRLYGVKNKELFERLPSHLKELMLSIIGKKIESENEVKIDGWKQGWNVSDIDEYELIVASYGPNKLGFLGLYIELVTLAILIGISGKEIYFRIKKNGK